MAKTDTNKLTREWLDRHGWTCWLVECRNRRIARDLFGIWDFIAIRPGETLAIQVTDTGHMADRVKKVQASPYLEQCIDAGWRCEVWGWKKPAGMTQWVPRIKVL